MWFKKFFEFVCVLIMLSRLKSIVKKMCSKCKDIAARLWETVTDKDNWCVFCLLIGVSTMGGIVSFVILKFVGAI